MTRIGVTVAFMALFFAMFAIGGLVFVAARLP
jgi:hypothetical protein